MSLYDKTNCYLSPDADKARATLVEKGMDSDLAVSLLEVVFGEGIYELPPAEEQGDGRTKKTGRCD